MSEIVLLSLALWVVTHVVAEEVPVTAHAPKPLSCQLCLSGWICLAVGIAVWLRWDFGLIALVASLAAWALSVIIEAIYLRLQTIII